MNESELIRIVENASEINGAREKLVYILESCGQSDARLLSNQELLEEFMFISLDFSGK